MLRNPASIRRWQRVLDALSSDLAIGTRLIEGRDDMATAWNFGPSDDDARPVSWIVERMLAAWGSPNGWDQPSTPQPHEAAMLKLDSRDRKSTRLNSSH